LEPFNFLLASVAFELALVALFDLSSSAFAPFVDLFALVALEPALVVFSAFTSSCLLVSTASMTTSGQFVGSSLHQFRYSPCTSSWAVDSGQLVGLSEHQALESAVSCVDDDQLLLLWTPA